MYQTNKTIMWIKVKNTIINLDKVQYINIVNNTTLNLMFNQKQGNYITLHFEDKKELDATIELLDVIIRSIDLS